MSKAITARLQELLDQKDQELHELGQKHSALYEQVHGTRFFWCAPRDIPPSDRPVPRLEALYEELDDEQFQTTVMLVLKGYGGQLKGHVLFSSRTGGGSLWTTYSRGDELYRSGAYIDGKRLAAEVLGLPYYRVAGDYVDRVEVKHAGSRTVYRLQYRTTDDPGSNAETGPWYDFADRSAKQSALEQCAAENGDGSGPTHWRVVEVAVSEQVIGIVPTPTDEGPDGTEDA